MCGFQTGQCGDAQCHSGRAVPGDHGGAHRCGHDDGSVRGRQTAGGTVPAGTANGKQSFDGLLGRTLGNETIAL